MKKSKQLHQWLRAVYVASVLLAMSATTWAANMVNTPIDETETIDGFVISATTFSAANNSEVTEKTSLTQEEIFWLKSSDYLTMASGYAATTGTSYGSESAPKYKITNGSNSGYASKLEADKNYLIFHAPTKETNVATISIEGYKPNSNVTVKFGIEELSGNDKTQLLIVVNNNYKSYQTIEKGSENQLEVYVNDASSSAYATNKLTIDIKRHNWNEGANCVFALSDFYVYGEVDALSASADKKTVALGESVTLSAKSGIGLDMSNVIWQVSTNGGMDYIQDVGQGESVTVQPLLGKNYYRAMALDDAGSSYFSEPIVITAIIECAGSSEVLFEENFGLLENEKARSAGNTEHINVYVEDTNEDGYTYVGDCGMLKEEGTYAVMANPKYGGCNINGAKDGCDCEDATELVNMWFRDIWDHTQGGKDENGKYGAMLMVNGDAELVYSRTVTGICTNSIMNFSAWFASASGPMKGIEEQYKPISMQFVVKDKNGDIIDDATLIVEDIDYEDGWVKGETSFNSGDNDELTVEIYNYQEGGQGNDFLVDDIRFTICKPKVQLIPSSHSNNPQFITIDGNKVNGMCEEHVALTVEETTANQIFDQPYYLWMIKTDGGAAFERIQAYDGITRLDTVITDMDVFVVMAADMQQAVDYINNPAQNKCALVAVTDTISISCPFMSVSFDPDCNDIYLSAMYSGSGEIVWQQSLDGENWEDITAEGFVGKGNENPVNPITISQNTYFRIKEKNSEKISDPVLAVVKKITIEATPATFDPDKGTLVSLKATIEGFKDPQTDEPITSSEDINWYYSTDEATVAGYMPWREQYGQMEADTTLTKETSFYVELEGCSSDTVTITEKSPVEIAVSRDCNKIYLTLTTLGTATWQRSADGVTWEDLTDADFKQDEQSQPYVEIGETTHFRAVVEETASDPVSMDFMELTLSIDQTDIRLGDEVKMEVTTNFSSNNAAVWYQEETAIDNEGDSYSPKPYAPATYYVELEGCKSNTVKVESVVWPTVFTPMVKDSYNDDFVVGMQPAISFAIFDRYGNLIVETTDGWDGKDRNGNFVFPDVYSYVATLSSGEVVKGFVELLNEKQK